MAARITGQSVQAEARRATTSHDLIKHIRVMRLRWLGFILRQESTRLIHCAIEIQGHFYNEGTLLMDAPQHRNIQELVVANGEGPSFLE